MVVLRCHGVSQDGQEGLRRCAGRTSDSGRDERRGGLLLGDEEVQELLVISGHLDLLQPCETRASPCLSTRSTFARMWMGPLLVIPRIHRHDSWEGAAYVTGACFQPPCPPCLIATRPARIERAISAGVRAPMSIPTGL